MNLVTNKIILQNMTFFPNKGGIDNYMLRLAEANPYSFFYFVVVDHSQYNELPKNVKLIGIFKIFKLPKPIKYLILKLDIIIWILIFIHDKICLKNHKETLRICRHPNFCFANYKRKTLFLMATALPKYIEFISARSGKIKRIFNKFRSIKMMFAERKLIESSIVGTLSQSKKKEIEEFYNLSSDEIKVIPPGIKKRKNKFSEKTLNKPINIITVCRISKEKNLDLIIKTAIKYREKGFNFKVLGDGPEKKRIDELIIEHKLENKVYMYGFIEDIYPYLEESDIFLLPSIYEGFGHVFLEAMSVALPCIGINPKFGYIVATNEFIEDGKNGIMINNNPDELYKAVKMITQNYEYYNKMRYWALKTANKFSWNKHLSIIFNLFLGEFD